MTEPEVWTFFYGSFINRDVLAVVGLVPGEIEVATLAGFDIRIEPLANLVRSDRHVVYGIVATATHAGLGRLYDYAENDLGARYLPEAVLTTTQEGKLRPAMCYLAPDMPKRPASADYVERITRPAREYGFPEWYVERLEGFRRSG
jgi:hypothetical protein